MDYVEEEKAKAEKKFQRQAKSETVVRQGLTLDKEHEEKKAVETSNMFGILDNLMSTTPVSRELDSIYGNFGSSSTTAGLVKNLDKTVTGQSSKRGATAEAQTRKRLRELTDQINSCNSTIKHHQHAVLRHSRDVGTQNMFSEKVALAQKKLDSLQRDALSLQNALKRSKSSKIKF